MESIQFEAWPKTPRLFKEPAIVSEKMDGTNAAIGIADGNWGDENDPFAYVSVDGQPYTVYAQSRNRIIAPVSLTGEKGSDNYNFAEFVFSHAEVLARTLGVGLHFGEWWGAGIARNYGQTRRYFSLFNTSRWKHLDVPQAREDLGIPDEIRVVPVMNINTLDTGVIRDCLQYLKEEGSIAAPGFMNPEGICVFLPGIGRTFKVTFDDEHKGAARRHDDQVLAV